MKNKNKSLYIFTGFALLLGSAIGLGNSPKASTVKATEVEMKRIFLDCKDYDAYDDEQSIGIQYEISDEWTRKEATKSADNYWYVDVPSEGLQAVQFFRCETGHPENSYADNWQWEGNNTVNYYEVTGWQNSGDWTVKNELEAHEIASTTPSTATKRIWIDPKDNFYDRGARAALRTFDGETHLKTYILAGSTQHITVNGDYLFYVDIPVGADCQLIRLCPSLDVIWAYSKNFTEITDYNTAKVVYASNADITGDNCTVGNPTATIDYAKLVLDGYSTCVDSDANGYGAINDIYNAVLLSLDDEDFETLVASTFTDPTWGVRTYGEKMYRMENPEESGEIINLNSFININESSNFWAIAITVLSLSALFATGIMLLKKRRL